MARCVSIDKYIKNLSVKTDNWLIGATATGLEVKGMYTSQTYSSFFLIHRDSALCFQSGQDLKMLNEKENKKNKPVIICHTHPHLLNLISLQNKRLQLWRLTLEGKGDILLFLPLKFCMMLC